jgi:hypothetical protein
MCNDLSKRTWIAVEEDGIYCYDPARPAAERWTRYTSLNGLADDSSYAMCCDRLGRIWAGSDRGGVSVFNGKNWKIYDQVNGPLGGHVYAIGASPVTGDIWMATECGVSRYSLHGDSWSYFVNPCSILLTQATCIAFNKAGDVVLGTQDSGIILGKASDDFKSWVSVPGPATPSLEPVGDGLPSAQINCLATRLDGTLFAGTNDGLAESVDGGGTWTFIHGADYLDRLQGLYANRKCRASVSGIEVMTPETYSRLGAHGANLGQWIAVAAADDPKNQFGVHITVSGGETSKPNGVVDISHIIHPAPQWVYQGERQGDFSYSFSNLTPNAPYEIRLHFSEMNFTGPGQRTFDVAVNGQPMIRGFDICAAAGRDHVAVVKDLSVKADAAGSLKVQFQSPQREMAEVVDEDKGLGLRANKLMSDNYVSCLAFSPDDRLFVGHWIMGAECYDLESKTFLPVDEYDQSGRVKNKLDFIQCMLATASGGVILGPYGGPIHIGTASGEVPVRAVVNKISKDPRISELPFPAPAAPPSLQEISALDQSAKKVEAPMLPGDGAFLGADWATRGNWVGRYGSRRAVLFAADSPFDHDIANDLSYSLHGDIGPNREERDGLRRWIEWLRTDDPRVLYDPVVGTRRESEYDDHAEDYPMAHEGPDVWITLDVPAGVHRVSAYFLNKDGREGLNRNRDYLVQLLPYRDDPWQALAQKPIASARVREFWNGVYESFSVCGPSKFYLAVRKNNSRNTTICSVMFDKITGPPTPFEVMNKAVPSVYLMVPECAAYTALPDAPAAALSPLATQSEAIWSDLSGVCGDAAQAGTAVPSRLLCYRALATAADDPAVNKELDYWRRSLPYNTRADVANFQTSMETIFKAETNFIPNIGRPNQ